MIPVPVGPNKLDWLLGEASLGVYFGRVKRIRHENARKKTREGVSMLWTIMAVLLVLWLVGVIGGYAFGGMVHLLLLFALVALVVQLFTGRRVV